MRRIQGHLRDVERFLRAHSPAELSLAQRQQRSAALDWLREYTQRGTFPHNYTRPGERVPVFVDEHGTPCAVAYLLRRSGEDALVREIARADNHVYTGTLAEERRLASWLEEMGLTPGEIARIQPGYIPRAPRPEPGESHAVRGAAEPASGAWRYVAPLSVGSALIAHLTDTRPGARPVVGAINGAFAVGHAGLAAHALLAEWGSDGAGRSAAINGALALVSAHAAWSRFRRRSETRSPVGSREGARAAMSRRPRILAPEAAWVGGGVGLQVRLVH
ncbi:hypothetical protein [Candidatus Palauibacter sp.]|uniref:hypothetical protein n=1 Tax=Candidatus Palauibacter sp. TaxID=3101350 RepID=UPI003C6F90E0